MSIRRHERSASDDEDSMRITKRAWSDRVSERDFYFADGDIVLAVEGLLFRVHQRILSRSPIFHNMLGMPQPPDSECYDGAPLVHLYGDAAKDWIATLRWLYNAHEFYRSAASFEELSGSLRISTKYELPELRLWSISCLAESLPSLELLPSLPLKESHKAASVIAIARECDVPDLLPAAFYSLSIENWSKQGDGGNSHRVLSPEDLRRIIVGREGLQILVDTFRATFNEMGKLGDHHLCQSSLQRQWDTRLRTRSNSPTGLCILRELQEMAYADVTDVCSEHLRIHRDLARDRLGITIAAIPNLFCLN